MAKKKLTLSIDEKVIKTAKLKALKADCSVSELFEYFIKATQKNKDLLADIVNSDKKKDQLMCQGNLGIPELTASQVNEDMPRKFLDTFNAPKYQELAPSMFFIEGACLTASSGVWGNRPIGKSFAELFQKRKRKDIDKGGNQLLFFIVIKGSACQYNT